MQPTVKEKTVGCGAIEQLRKIRPEKLPASLRDLKKSGEKIGVMLKVNKLSGYNPGGLGAKKKNPLSLRKG
ncbi:MAG TPA: hypothetical protein ENN13_01265 [Candidatus Altiarchaeales archaeon]|nr:hypothetical protein [Candidatus Altiarchaeales archaeon]